MTGAACRSPGHRCPGMPHRRVTELSLVVPGQAAARRTTKGQGLWEKGASPTLSTQESKNSRAAWRAEPKEHSSMNWENICVRSSCEYSLWLERSRDLRKSEWGERDRGQVPGTPLPLCPSDPLSWLLAQLAHLPQMSLTNQVPQQ